MSSMILLRNGFAEILPRFISKPMTHKAHKRIFSDRDPLFYWLYARYEFGAGISLVFITPRSAVRSRPRYHNPQYFNNIRPDSSWTLLGCRDYAENEIDLRQERAFNPLTSRIESIT